MPRFHVNVHDGRSEIDDDGTDLPDRQAARLEAIRHAGLIVLNEPHHPAYGEDWRMEVTDETGFVLFRLDVSVVAAPVLSGALCQRRG